MELLNQNKIFKSIFAVTLLILMNNTLYAEEVVQNDTLNKAVNLSNSPSERRLIKILSIDGGGVRGIIPAMVLENLESRLASGKHLAEHFDIIAGTSAGGIIALMLTAPDNTGKPKYSTSYIVEELTSNAREVFSPSVWQRLKSGNGWLSAKYDETPLVNKLQKYFGDIKLNQTTTEVIIPAYEIELDKTFFFKSKRARSEPAHNCYIRELAYATSAAPTYFPPAKLTTDDNQRKKLTLIDGGVSANNPTLAAAVHAVELYGTNIDLFVVSIGTGTEYGAHKKKSNYSAIASEIFTLSAF